MKVEELLEKLDEFEHMLREFEAGTKGIMGSPASDAISDVLAKRQQAHHSLDDFSLALVRRYKTLRPFIKMYSKCFISISAAEAEPEETYLALIQRGARSFQQIYDDLKFIRTQLEQFEPGTELDPDS